MLTEYNACESAVHRPKVKEANFHGKEAHLIHREEEPSAILCTMTLDTLDTSGEGSRYPVGISPIIDPDTGEVPVDSKGRRSYSTSMSYCPSIEKHVVMGYLPREIAKKGKQLSLEGKANQLSTMIRQNLPAAMQGMVVIPLFAGFDTREKIGRIFQYDVTGGRYEEKSFATTGSGSLHATTVIKLGFQSELSLSNATELAANAIFEASEEDSATGGPDLIRDVFPTISSITQDGFSPVPHSDVSAIFNRIIENRISRNGDLK